MNKEFVPYQESLELKELGFDEDSFGYYDTEGLQIRYDFLNTTNKNSLFTEHSITNNPKISAPTFSQAFRFFREKYRLHQYIKQYNGENFFFHIEDMVHPRRFDEYPVEILRCYNESFSQEETELACLKKLIEIVKSHK